jgi:hypothetical protein
MTNIEGMTKPELRSDADRVGIRHLVIPESFGIRASSFSS